ncbi:MAG TPA: FAD-dependent oxidoreductase [Clostridiaceae bacterium]|nr:FAD-dependent oxidoreductase [Clostridiaceae bacterium]
MNDMKLFKPGQIGAVSIRNRTVMTAMGNGLAAADATVSDDSIEFYAARARGGVGLIITEYCQVDSETGVSSPRQIALNNLRHLAGIEKLATAVHQHEAKFFVQLHHPGRQTRSGLQPAGEIIAPSPIPCPIINEVPREMTLEEIGAMIKKFVTSAVLAKTAGADGVEVHAAHGYLLNQFLSPASNKRTDAYGGSLENRAKIVEQIVGGIRQYCGPKFGISVRISGEEYIEGGLQLEETVQLAQRFEKAGADAINVSNATFAYKEKFMEPYFFEEGWKKYLAKTIKEAVNIPVIAVNTVKHPAFAESLLQEGVSDFVGLARALVADPDWVNKTKQNQSDDIIPCIGCMYCLNEYTGGRRVKCAVNPRVGREKQFADLTKKRTAVAADDRANAPKAVIIGAGPAGLTAAKLMVHEGYDVTILEKNRELGGALKAATISEEKYLIDEYKEVLIRQAKNAGVKIEMGIDATPEVVKSYKPDRVLIACGGAPIAPQSFIESPHPNIKVWDEIIENCEDINKQKIVIIGGGLTGLELGDELTQDGKDNHITIVEMLASLGGTVSPMISGVIAGRIKDRGSDILLNHRVVSFDEKGVNVVNNEDEEIHIDADMVIIAMGIRPTVDPSAYEAEGIETVYTIGDARRGGTIATATRDAYESVWRINQE